MIGSGLALGMLCSAAVAGGPEALAVPDHVVLGKSAVVQVRVRASDCAELEARASLGALTPLGARGDECRFTWTAPNSKLPATALLAFWTRTRAAPEPFILRIPLYGRTELEAETEPGAIVSVEVGNSRFGPEHADRKGRVRVGIDVPPGTVTASVVAEASGRITRREAALAVPAPNPIALFVLPGAEVGGSAWVIVASAGPLQVGDLDLRATGGVPELVSSDSSRAVYRFALTVPGALDVQVGVRGTPAAHAEGSATLAPLPAEPPPGPPRAWSPFATLGAFYGGSAAAGAGAALGVGLRRPFERFPLVAELAAGVGSIGVVTLPASGIELDSSVTLFPVEVAIRARLWESSPWSLDLKLGGGAIPYNLVARSLIQAGFTDGGVLPEGLIAAQGAYSVEGWMVFLELRGQLTPGLSARVPTALSGAGIALGLRYGSR